VKVLVIKIAAIGDFLMATPALRALKLDPAVDSVTLLAGASIAAVVGKTPPLPSMAAVLEMPSRARTLTAAMSMPPKRSCSTTSVSSPR